MRPIFAALALVLLISVSVKSDAEAEEEAFARQVRQANAEEMVQNILQWLQGVYKQTNRKARQGNFAYLPPAGQNAERPRPFRPPSSSSTQRPNRPSSSTPYEPSSNTPYQPTGSSSNTPYQPTGSSSNTPYQPTGSSSGAPYPPSSQQYPDVSQSGYPLPGPSPQPPFISPQPDYSSGSPSYQSSYIPPQTSPQYQPSSPASGPSGPSTRPQEPSRPSSPAFSNTDNQFQPIPTQPPQGYPTQPPSSPGYQSSASPSTPPYAPSRPSYQPSSSTPGYQPSSPSGPGFQTGPSTPSNPSSPLPDDDDDRHPPHIHAIDVQCAKDMMTINLEFNKVYNGIIYSKGFYSNPNCRYVQENSNKIKYTFTLSLNSCGTEFINGFETQGQSYLENVLVLQNEPGIQEVWDSIRSVRCLWEGNLNKQLSIALSVGMLNQEVVTFSGDTAMASLDIQMGRGPFAPPANGLVKIGETMTLVVSITGDPGFDVQVKECRARDNSGNNVVRLTDENGCILKPKLFGAFQKTRDTGNTGASIIAYAFFNAFKFPDVMDLTLECNVELCKVNCEMCPDPNQRIEPGRRRRRDVFYSNDTLYDPIKVGKALRVVLPEDISFSEPIGVCVSQSSFLWGAIFILLITALSCISAAWMWLKLQRYSMDKTRM